MLIQVNEIEKNYPNFALRCSMQLEEGRITGLVGQNGAGKTTLFKSILGLVKTDKGTVNMLGKSPEKLGRQEKEQIGVALADASFSEYLTVEEIAKVSENMYKAFDRNEFLEQCRRFRLPLKEAVKSFSTGMKAKLRVLIATGHQAKLLILDEPTAGLDVVARDEVLGLLREYMETEGRSILISSHISSDLEGLCDDIYMIHNGQIVLHEDTDVLLDDYGILKLDEKQYDKVDKQYLKYRLKESFGYSCLTNQRRFYEENYPDIVVEKGTIDAVISTVIKGEAL